MYAAAEGARYSSQMMQYMQLPVVVICYVHIRALLSFSCTLMFAHCVRQGHAFWRMSWTQASTCPHLCVSSHSTCNKCKR